MNTIQLTMEFGQLGITFVSIVVTTMITVVFLDITTVPEEAYNND